MVDICSVSAEETYALRQRVLRPTQTLAQCHYRGDDHKGSMHFAVKDHTEIVGIISVYPQQHQQLAFSDLWRIRGMAVAESHRNKHYGRALLKRTESYVRQSGGMCIWANARLVAIPFYTRSGYHITGPQFEIDDIGPHYLIYKRLHP